MATVYRLSCMEKIKINKNNNVAQQIWKIENVSNAKKSTWVELLGTAPSVSRQLQCGLDHVVTYIQVGCKLPKLLHQCHHFIAVAASWRRGGDNKIHFMTLTPFFKVFVEESIACKFLS